MSVCEYTCVCVRIVQVHISKYVKFQRMLKAVGLQLVTSSMIYIIAS